jgi:hypothetical protein
MEKLSVIEKYGKSILDQNPDIINKRVIGTISEIWNEIPSDYSNMIIHTFLENILYKLNFINIDDYNYKIIEKINKSGYSMKWHIDDCQILKHSNKMAKFKNTLTNQFFISSRQSICYNDNGTIPLYSLIIYDSDYNIDFQGGSLEFVDGLKIYPKRGLYIFFDSREVHRVNKIKSGLRKSILVKFYKK